jgi:acetyl-CoA C-acetyltransferase
MTDVVITAAKRTPVGAFLGSFAATPAHELGRVAIEAALAQSGVSADEVSEVILGQVLTAAQGQNPARQASMAAGVPKEVPAWGLNQVCGSGLRAVAVAAQSIIAGDARVVVAGGQESMSLSSHAQNIRPGTKMGNLELVDTMIKDGLMDAFNGYHMGITAENLAEQYQITRSDQDTFATASQNKAERARREGRFADEIAPVTVKSRKGELVVDRDEFIRDGVEVSALAGLRPAFKKDGSVTAGNASGINERAGARPCLAGWRASLPPGSIRRSWASARFRRRAARSRKRAGRSTISTSSKPTKPLLRRPWRSARSLGGMPKR